MSKKHALKILCAALLTCAFLSGCGDVPVQEVGKLSTDTQYSMFVLIENAESWRVYYHRDTKVMYVMSDGPYVIGTFTVMLNPDGTPQIWEGEE